MWHIMCRLYTYKFYFLHSFSLFLYTALASLLLSFSIGGKKRRIRESSSSSSGSLLLLLLHHHLLTKCLLLLFLARNVRMQYISLSSYFSRILLIYKFVCCVFIPSLQFYDGLCNRRTHITSHTSLRIFLILIDMMITWCDVIRGFKLFCNKLLPASKTLLAARIHTHNFPPPSFNPSETFYWVWKRWGRRKFFSFFSLTPAKWVWECKLF